MFLFYFRNIFFSIFEIISKYNGNNTTKVVQSIPQEANPRCVGSRPQTPVWAVSVLVFAVGIQEWCSRLGCLRFEFCDFLLSRVLLSINFQVAEGEKTQL